MTKDVELLLNYLQPEKIDDFLFSRDSPAWPARVFGGQVLAQALAGAISTVALAMQWVSASLAILI